MRNKHHEVELAHRVIIIHAKNEERRKQAERDNVEWYGQEQLPSLPDAPAPPMPALVRNKKYRPPPKKR